MTGRAGRGMTNFFVWRNPETFSKIGCRVPAGAGFLQNLDLGNLSFCVFSPRSHIGTSIQAIADAPTQAPTLARDGGHRTHEHRADVYAAEGAAAAARQARAAAAAATAAAGTSAAAA